jgi:tetratricopeptide (TPR) repeat protein
MTETISAAPRTASSDNTSNSYKQGLSYLTAGRNAEAVEALRQVVQRNPEDAVAYAKLGLAYSALHQYKEAVAVFKMAIHVKGEVVDAESYFRLGEAYTALGKYSDALGAFKQAMYIIRAHAIEPDPTKYQGFPAPAEAHYGLGLAYNNLGRYHEAIKELKEAATLKQKFAEAYYGIALAYLGLGDRKAAKKQEEILRPLNAALADTLAAALSPAPIWPPGVTQGDLRRP